MVGPLIPERMALMCRPELNRHGDSDAHHALPAVQTGKHGIETSPLVSIPLLERERWLTNRNDPPPTHHPSLLILLPQLTTPHQSQWHSTARTSEVLNSSITTTTRNPNLVTTPKPTISTTTTLLTLLLCSPMLSPGSMVFRILMGVMMR